MRSLSILRLLTLTHFLTISPYLFAIFSHLAYDVYRHWYRLRLLCMFFLHKFSFFPQLENKALWMFKLKVSQWFFRSRIFVVSRFCHELWFWYAATLWSEVWRTGAAPPNQVSEGYGCWQVIALWMWTVLFFLKKKYLFYVYLWMPAYMCASCWAPLPEETRRGHRIPCN